MDTMTQEPEIDKGYRDRVLQAVKALDTHDLFRAKEFTNGDRMWLIYHLYREYGKARKYETFTLSTGLMVIYRTL